MTKKPTCRVRIGDREWTLVPGDKALTIGREGIASLGDNPYLHRHFLEVGEVDGLWWLINVGSRLAAQVSDGDGGLQATLSPGGRLPLMFEHTGVLFTAGEFAYSMTIRTGVPTFRSVPRLTSTTGETTYGAVALTTSQRALIVALAEPLLRQGGATVSEIPSSTAAAQRLGWTQTRFNRKLDNVCDKFDAVGVTGLRGGPRRHAMQRRGRLVEYAVSTRIITSADLPLLDFDLEADA